MPAGQGSLGTEVRGQDSGDFLLWLWAKPLWPGHAAPGALHPGLRGLEGLEPNVCEFYTDVQAQTQHHML